MVVAFQGNFIDWSAASNGFRRAVAQYLACTVKCDPYFCCVFWSDFECMCTQKLVDTLKGYSSLDWLNFDFLHAILAQRSIKALLKDWWHHWKVYSFCIYFVKSGGRKVYSFLISCVKSVRFLNGLCKHCLQMWVWETKETNILEYKACKKK